MAISAGATNLFFNRDTKVFVGQSLGAPVGLAATLLSSNAMTTTVAHGLTTGDKVIFSDVTGLTGLTVATIYYAIVMTATTFKVAVDVASAVAGTAVTATGTPTAGTTYAYAVDSYVSATAVTPGANTLVVTAAHMFKAGDVVAVKNISLTSDSSNLVFSGTFVVASVTGNTAFTLTATGATATGAFAAPTQVQFVKINLWEMPVLAGYAANQAVETSEITLNEMSNSSGVSRRGRQMFNNALSPTEWSFDTYVRPFKSTNHYAVEEPLWAVMVGNNYGIVTGIGTPGSPTPSTGVTAWALGATRTSSVLTWSFANSNSVTLGKLDIYLVLGAAKVTGCDYTVTDGGSTTIYKVTDAVVNEASIGFDIDGITTISWSGMGSNLTELGYFYGTLAVTNGNTNTNNFIRNRLTALTAVSSSTTGSVTYNITLTGGNISISNNISYLTPEVLGIVNRPIGHVTGTRTVTGTFNAYLDELTNSTADLFQNLAEKYNTVVQNSFALDFYIGGFTNTDVVTAPGIQFTFDQAHLEVPKVNFDDVVGVECSFHALPSTVGGADEIGAIRYIGTT